jgi:hypothetical protein
MVKAVDDKQLVDLLKRALAAVENSGAPDDLREAAFTAAIRMLSGGAAVVSQPEVQTDGHNRICRRDPPGNDLRTARL